MSNFHYFNLSKLRGNGHHKLVSLSNEKVYCKNSTTNFIRSVFFSTNFTYHQISFKITKYPNFRTKGTFYLICFVNVLLKHFKMDTSRYLYCTCKMHYVCHFQIFFLIYYHLIILLYGIKNHSINYMYKVFYHLYLGLEKLLWMSCRSDHVSHRE